MVTKETTGKEITQEEEKQIPKEEQIPGEKQVLKEEQTPEEKRIPPVEETCDSKSLASDVDSSKSPKEDFSVVGIGASAGGLAAFEAFFSTMPDRLSPGIAFVLVQHLDPKHKSLLPDLIERFTNMPVYEVSDRMAVEPNSVYIIPPGRDMIFQDGTLRLLEPAEPRGRRLPIDSFFRSLAEEKKEKAIGIVLSGTGSDGTLGVRAIKAEGGMVMAQTLESSEYNGMPQSVIATGLVDYILPPEEMPAQIIAYVTQAFGKTFRQALRAEDVMKRIFNLVLTQTGHDFSHYKKGTITRRIERRMAVHHITSIDEYMHYLEQNSIEVETLFRDFIINVTNFFRSPDAFDALRKEVIPNLFTDRLAGEAIRIWVPGCSTGEEAYSIGILLQEYMKTLKQTFNVQIFATDIDDRAIEQARIGVYPASITVDVSPERLGRFFTNDPDGNYRIQKIIRDMIIFSVHDLAKDPPFSKLDLVSCRNVLIYMDGELQKRLIPLFYYALKSGGFLFLGSSETVSGFTNLFDMLDRKAKLYQSKPNAGNEQLRSVATFIPPRLERRITQRPAKEIHIEEGKLKLHELTEKMLLQYYAPAGVLVDEKGDILYVRGRVGMYMELAQGRTSVNILKMTREGLQQKLITALHKAVVDKKPVFYSGLRVKTNGDFTTVNMALLPVAASPYATEGPDLYLTTFEETPKSEQKKTEKAASRDVKDKACESTMEVDELILALKRELQTKEEDLKASNEELETSNEELKASNEEMQSINEEFQSTNEELESSKEELQSVNEELNTVNAELQHKVADLSQANNDMSNLLAGTGIGTIFVDNQLQIIRFTPEATRVINLIPTDVGRPLGHTVSNLLGYDHLTEDIRQVLDNLMPKNIEVQARDDKWYLMSIRTYRTLENVINGAVITFTEITELKQTKELLKESEAMIYRLAVAVRDSNDAVTVQDLEGRILAWNPKAERMYGWSEAEALKMNISSLVPQNRREKELDMVRKLSRAEVLEPYRTERLNKDGRILEVWLTASSLVDETGEVYSIITTEREIKSGSLWGGGKGQTK